MAYEIETCLKTTLENMWNWLSYDRCLKMMLLQEVDAKYNRYVGTDAMSVCAETSGVPPLQEPDNVWRL